MNAKIRYLIIIVSTVFFGLLLLYFSGKFFLTEITKEIEVKESREVVATGIGKPLPFFELDDLDEKKNKSTDFLGTPLVLTFWTTWNQASADQIKILDDYLRKDSNNLFNIISISSQEDKSVVANFVKRGGYKVKVFLDESGMITDVYRARVLPVTYFADKDGILKEVFVGALSEKMILERIENVLK